MQLSFFFSLMHYSDLCTSNLKLQRRWSCKAIFDMLKQPPTLMAGGTKWEKQEKYNHKGRLKGGDVKQKQNYESYKKSYHHRTRHHRWECTSSDVALEPVPNAKPIEERLSLHGAQNLKESQERINKHFTNLRRKWVREVSRVKKA